MHPYVVVSHRFDGPCFEKGLCVAKRKRSPPVCATFGALLSTEINCTAVDSYSNAQWPKTAAGSTAAGTCGAGFVAGTPLRACLITGDWSDTVTNPCERRWSLRRPTYNCDFFLMTASVCFGPIAMVRQPSLVRR